MPIPWMVALKVIPWGDVIEHAPKVLNAARKLLDKKTIDSSAIDVAATTDVPLEPGSPAALQARLIDAENRLNEQVAVQAQLAQTLSELAEQNARLVDAVQLLRVRTRLLMGGVLLLSLGLGLGLLFLR